MRRHAAADSSENAVCIWQQVGCLELSNVIGVVCGGGWVPRGQLYSVISLLRCPVLTHWLHQMRLYGAADSSGNAVCAPQQVGCLELSNVIGVVCGGGWVPRGQLYSVISLLRCPVLTHWLHQMRLYGAADSSGNAVCAPQQVGCLELSNVIGVVNHCVWMYCSACVNMARNSISKLQIYDHVVMYYLLNPINFAKFLCNISQWDISKMSQPTTRSTRPHVSKRGAQACDLKHGTANRTSPL